MVNTYKFKELWDINRSLKAIDMFAEVMLTGHTAEWIALNYDTTEEAVKRAISKYKSVSVQPVVADYTYVDRYNFYAYCSEVGFAPKDIEILKFAFGLNHEEELNEELTRCHQLVGQLFVIMKLTGAIYTDRSKEAKVFSGDNSAPFYNKYLSTFFGLYPTLSGKDRELFNTIQLEGGSHACFVVDAWFYRMSRAGIAAKHNTSVSNVVKFTNVIARRVFGSHIPMPSTPPTTVDMDYFFNLLVNNDISEHPSLIVSCLKSDQIVEDYLANYPHIDQKKFLKELDETLVEVYRLMRNSNKHLVVDSKTSNIQSYYKFGTPFDSIYMTSSASLALI